MNSGTSFSIIPEHYFSEERVALECAVLETKLWGFAGLATDVARHNDYITVVIGRKSVIIQNFNGRLRAFENVCAHRFARLRSCEKGNALLRCPYHSWVYNEEGVPVSIPLNDDAFGFDDAARNSHRLKQWQIEQCGDLVFIRQDRSGPTLRNTLGSLFDELQFLSQCIGEEVEGFTSEYQANWKICVENSIDEYHAAFVHPTTFRPLLSSRFTYEYGNFSSKVEAELTDNSLRNWKRIEKHFLPRPLQTDTYLHYLLFPLSAIASTFGAHFSIQSLTPLSANRTLFQTRLFLTKDPGRSSPSGAAEALGKSVADFNRTVFLEDKVICEQVQLGLQQRPDFSGVIGRFESRIAHFHKCLAAAFS